MVEANYLHSGDEWQFTAVGALVSGEVIQGPDGMAAVVGGLAGFAAGSKAVAFRKGVFNIAKTTGAIGKGSRLDWNDTLGYVVAAGSGTFPCGTCNCTAASGDTTVEVALNEYPSSGAITLATEFIGAGTVAIITAPYGLRLIDWWFVCTDNVEGTVKLSDGTHDMTATVAHGEVDKALVRGTNIDDLYHELTPGATASVVVATGGNGILYTRWLPVLKTTGQANP